MKVLIVASGNANSISPFVLDQANALTRKGVKIDFFLIKGKGILGYINNYKLLLEKIKRFKPEIIHAHYGLSGLLSALQNKVPIVTTFHGSDINLKKIRFFSKIANKLSAESIFVSYDLARELKKIDPIVIPCGVDLDVFYPINKIAARKKIGLSLKKKYLLFSSSFNNPVKNYPLAKEAISKIEHIDLELIELKGYQRNEVALLMNSVDSVLMTSFREGSPQFIKEAMACNTPIVTTKVGDVSYIIKNTKGCYIADTDPVDVQLKIQQVLKFEKRTTGRKDIKHLDNKVIADKIIRVYNCIIN
jgi:glycosyltransferase involved in cell wall biosynthesis